MLGTVAGEAGKRIVKALKKSDVEKAIKAGEEAVKEWEEQLQPSQLLFFHAPPDGLNGVKNFLQGYFTNAAVLAELQKPIN